MHQIYISFPFAIKYDKKQEFYDFCKKKKIQIIDRVRETNGRKQLEEWIPSDGHYSVFVRFKDTAKFSLETDQEFYKFIDERRVLFIRFFISGKYSRMMEIWQLDLYGKFIKLTDMQNIHYMTLLDVGWIVNETSHFGIRDLYMPENKIKKDIVETGKQTELLS